MIMQGGGGKSRVCELEVSRENISQSSHRVQILIGLQFVRVCGRYLHTALGTANSLRL